MPGEQQGWKVYFVADSTWAGKALPVAARKIGPLLFHLTTPGGGEIPRGGWTITHEATGGRIVCAHTLDQAERIAEELAQESVWDFGTLQEFRLRRMAIKEAIEAALKRTGETWSFDGVKFIVETPRRLHAR